MLFCDGCDRGFHLKCCHPPLVDIPTGRHILCISVEILLSVVDDKISAYQKQVLCLHLYVYHCTLLLLL